jgi:hypothetical protein
MARISAPVTVLLAAIYGIGGSVTARDIGAAAAATPPRAAPTRSATVPFTLDHNRMLVEVEFTSADRSIRKARAWVDTGNEVIVLAEPLARDLGLDLSSLKAGETEHSVESASETPPMSVGGMQLDIEGIATRIRPGTHLRAGVSVEVQLPASALRHRHVVLDYPAQRLTVAAAGVRKPRGVAIPCRVNPGTGLFMIAATIDGETVWLGVDNGSAGTWVSRTLTTAWQKRHPNWRYASGAAGSANFFGFPFESQGVRMRLSELGLGAMRARDVAVLGLDQSLFDWYSKKSAGPVLGFIGANVLKNFRVEIDFPGQMTWWEAGPRAVDHDLDIVGLTLHPETGGGVTVAGVVTRDGKPLVEGVRPGDRLLRVGPLDISTAAMGAVVDALRGRPGETRELVVERDGARHTVEAKVVRLP